jgi:hypothetical protein
MGAPRLTKLYATSGRCSKNVTGSMRMIGPTFSVTRGVCKRWVHTTDPYLVSGLISVVECEDSMERHLRMGHQHKFIPPVRFEYLVNFGTHFLFEQSLSRQSKTDMAMIPILSQCPSAFFVSLLISASKST